jgi:dolichyl-phosphate-mannose--protein O-mannosyl transferase
MCSGPTLGLQHVATKKWLHSHVHQSPISQNQEVSCYGGADDSNEAGPRPRRHMP